MTVAGFEVDVEALRRVGRDVTQAAASLRKTVKGAGTGLAPASRSGSVAGAAAQQAETAWLAALGGLIGRVDEYGTELATAAQEYETADQTSGDGFRLAAAELGP